MSVDGQGTKCRRNIAENLNRLSRAHERYRRQTTDRQTTDGRAIAYSEREREFTFAKNAQRQSCSAINCLSSGINILAEGIAPFPRYLNAKKPTRIGSTCVAHTSPHSAAAVTSLRHYLRSAHWLANSLKLAARCLVCGCWPSCFVRHVTKPSSTCVETAFRLGTHYPCSQPVNTHRVHGCRK